MAPLNQEFDLLSLSTHDIFDDNHECNHAPLHASISRRKVSFGAVVSTHEIPNRSDYTADELEASWFDSRDMKQMKVNARSEAKLLDSGVATLHSRGLESRTRAGRRNKKQSRINAYTAVFFELDYQYDEQIYNEDLIADAYFEYTEHSAIAAHDLAKQDAMEAMAIHSE